MNTKDEIFHSNLTQESQALLVSSILSNLQKSYEERIEAHENARELMNDLAEAGKSLRAES